jgi:hypothetical protein
VSVVTAFVRRKTKRRQAAALQNARLISEGDVPGFSIALLRGGGIEALKKLRSQQPG